MACPLHIRRKSYRFEPDAAEAIAMGDVKWLSRTGAGRSPAGRSHTRTKVDFEQE